MMGIRSTVIVYDQLRVNNLRPVFFKYHSLKLQKVFFCSHVVSPDVSVSFGFALGLSLFIGSSQIIHICNLLDDMSFPLWHVRVVVFPFSFLPYTIFFRSVNSSPLAWNRCPKLSRINLLTLLAVSTSLSA